MNEFELSILDRIQEHLQCAFLDWFAPLITKLGDAGIFWILVAITLLFFKKTRKTGLMMGAALLMGVLVGNLTLKPLVARIRPYDINTGVALLVERLHDYSFPSGHTLASFESAVVLFIRDKRMGIPAMVIAVLVALSRLYLYVHYPTDVLAGVLLGTLFALIAVRLVGTLWDKYAKKEECV